MQQNNIPARMFTSEVLRLAKWGRSKLNAMQKRGEFPKRVDRGREDIYDGLQVYQALGLVNGAALTSNPWD